ncbi:MAG: hypothetical protein BECKG1743D_GA0114223_104991, partial [Candidatus Kentron sp. G]
PADVKCLSLLYLYVGRYPRNNASRNTPTGFSDQSDAIHPAGFPIITISIRCWFAIDIAIRYRYRSCPAFPIASSDIDFDPERTTTPVAVLRAETNASFRTTNRFS